MTGSAIRKRVGRRALSNGKLYKGDLWLPGKVNSVKHLDWLFSTCYKFVSTIITYFLHIHCDL